MESKLKHLELIQGVVNRMAQNSFLLKGWTVTLVAALLALSSAFEERIALVSISFLPTIVFWILDGYFLWQERLFRGIYNSVIKKKEEEIDFRMNPQDFIGKQNTWLRSMFSKTLNIFYLSVIIVQISMIIYLVYG